MAALTYADHLVRCFLWMLWYVPAFGAALVFGFPAVCEAQLKAQLGVAATLPVLESPMREAAMLVVVLVCACQNLSQLIPSAPRRAARLAHLLVLHPPPH